MPNINTINGRFDQLEKTIQESKYTYYNNIHSVQEQQKEIQNEIKLHANLIDEIHRV